MHVELLMQANGFSCEIAKGKNVRRGEGDFVLAVSFLFQVFSYILVCSETV